MTVKKLTKYCLSMKYAVLEYPFGPDPAVFKIGGKIFAMLFQKNGIARLGVKSDLMTADFMRQQYPTITSMYRSNQWISLPCDESIPDKEILSQVDNSYVIIWKSLTKKMRVRLEQESHPLYLFPDPRYQPLEVREGDEYFVNGIFFFNITRLSEHIAGNPKEYTLDSVKVSDYRKEPADIKPEDYPFLDLNQPILLAEISPGRYNVIDGHHRLGKAFNDGVDCLPAYLLPPKQHSLFITKKESYDAYLGYWNEKLAYYNT